MTTEEKLEALESKKREYIKQINAQKEKLRRANKKKERAESDHRLIEIGAIVESNFGILDDEKRISLNEFLKKAIPTMRDNQEQHIAIKQIFENYHNYRTTHEQ